MPIERLHVVVRGAVQGVGFRPFVYRLATAMQLNGWVLNSSQGVFVEAEGERPRLDEFLLRIGKEKPRNSYIQSLESSFLDPAGFTNFEIRESDDTGAPTALVMPDLAICPDCLNDISDPNNRRYRYPFTNCTNCGPRFTIIESLPYDRPSTTMKHFVMCDDCRREFENPNDRRFHAQPNACPACGPRVELWDERGNVLSTHDEAMRTTADLIRSGRIVAVKGLGGFHLIVDARSDDAVATLRARKHREEKPLAIMVSSLDAARQLCGISPFEERLLTSSESPIVLLEKKDKQLTTSNLQHPTYNIQLSSLISPRNPYLGVMLPYTPLHHILLTDLGFPVVATSGNLSDEPICTDEHEAVERLGGLADAFLVHNRPIVRHVDDSIVRVMAGREIVLRRSRGYAPLPVTLHSPVPAPLLAVGAHLKNTVAVASGNNVFISQHIGDLETQEALTAFKNVIASLEKLYKLSPQKVVCDEHPDYLSTKHAKDLGIETVAVQHHYAHIASCMAENELEGEVLGVAWDGTGFGPDGTVWGGEFLLTHEGGFTRTATFRSFPLPGSDQAVREPRRVALGMLYTRMGDEAFARTDLPCIVSFTSIELGAIRTMLQKNIRSPLTSSAGRLFDGVASLIGLRQQTNYEGETAMELEFSIGDCSTDEVYQFQLTQNDLLSTRSSNTPQLLSALQPETINYKPETFISWFPIVDGILADRSKGLPTGFISAKFHNTLAEIIIAVAKSVNQKRVALSGGCFQNKYLTERTIQRLREEGYKPYWHQRVPPNDGGIALGQIAVASKSKA